ncbi:hypothetical protein Lalb_Chr05g0212181 [Lupinus albus]|uniref:Uncharacterized protein n=1 Tax=Lupinus albus TaxID=3870 RepID=A0A6A4QHF5_LUPAL|nr:hypothetical protein Lalb_Chr05g0212181 [Lupinus albus]
MMKQRKEEGDGFASNTKEVVVPRSPPHQKLRVCLRPRAEESVTKREIAMFWRQKRNEEEDHLFAAIKAAARLRARNLSANNGVQEQDYWSFVLSLNTYHDEDRPKEAMEKRVAVGNDDKEICVGIKDWWTKSNYAYLNQPALDSMEPPKKQTSTYVPNYLSYKPKALYPTAIGVF